MVNEYDAWKAEVDDLLLELLGVRVQELEEWEWNKAFDDELPPEEAVIEFLSDFRNYLVLYDEYNRRVAKCNVEVMT